MRGKVRIAPRARWSYQKDMAEYGARHRRGIVLLMLLPLLLFLFAATLYLKEISSRIAVSDAGDIVTSQVNGVIAEVMREGDFDGEYFVSFEKNDLGEVTAISSNMARINALSAEAARSGALQT